MPDDGALATIIHLLLWHALTTFHPAVGDQDLISLTNRAVRILHDRYVFVKLSGLRGERDTTETAFVRLFDFHVDCAPLPRRDDGSQPSALRGSSSVAGSRVGRLLRHVGPGCV